jgi:thiol-disulfide isomerase/thioredoxin
MKFTTLLILTSWLFLLSAYVNEPTGIQFFSGSWQQVLAEAKRQNKPIFIDFYTNWCPPCRRMNLEAFPNADIGIKFNEHFINYQVNAEIGEGFTLAQRYAVASYPTALYLLPTGELVHRGVGYGGVKAMLKQADMVLAMPQVRRARRKRVIATNLEPAVLQSSKDTIGVDSIRN